MIFHFQKISAIILLIASFWPSTNLRAQLQPGQPIIKVTKISKPDACPTGGFTLEEGYVKSTRGSALIDVVVYLQHYHGDWERKVYQRRGSGTILFDLTSCDYTGNFYLFAVYQETGQSIVPTKSQVIAKHASFGARPKFRVSEKSLLKNCQGGSGASFVSGEIFTPKGEAVSLTFFMKKKDGSWRKKQFYYTGSGPIPLNIKDCDLSGEYKSLIQFAKR